jgi:hypothetical protein
MYEYVQTATGWVLCWGGAALYREVLERRLQVVPARDIPTPAGGEKAADKPVSALSA